MDVLIAVLACGLGFWVGYRFRIWYALRRATEAQEPPDSTTGQEG